MKEVSVDSLRDKHSNLDNYIKRLEDSNYQLKQGLEKLQATLRLERLQSIHLKEMIIQDDLNFQTKIEKLKEEWYKGVLNG
tara:strand:+ start:1960 stop:2202 length:243 start_codon:yes stop_codon:yes gene_type:complete